MNTETDPNIVQIMPAEEGTRVVFIMETEDGDPRIIHRVLCWALVDDQEQGCKRVVGLYSEGYDSLSAVGYFNNDRFWRYLLPGELEPTVGEGFTELQSIKDMRDRGFLYAVGHEHNGNMPYTAVDKLRPYHEDPHGALERLLASGRVCFDDESLPLEQRRIRAVPLPGEEPANN